MTKLKIALAVATILGGASAATAGEYSPTIQVQEGGLSHPERVEKLKQRYGEDPRGIGLTASGNVVELFFSPDGSTWTLLITFPSGVSKMLQVGQFWDIIAAPVNKTAL